MGETGDTIRRILVPLDLSRLSEGKIPSAEAQARAFGAEIVLLHVISASPPADADVTLAETQAVSWLDAIATRLRSEGITAQALVRYGSVSEIVLQEIERQNIDLVVIGSSVRRGISRLLLGSTAEDIIANSRCPVLLIRPDVSEAERASPVRSFDDDVSRTGPVAPHRLGLRTVDVARIVGSVGRAAELDDSFRVHDTGKLERDRYQHIWSLMANGEPLPPVSLYKLGYGYYVLDGHHRVAAARHLGQMAIEAEVTEFVPLGRRPGARRVFAERRSFERATGLTKIGLTQPGNYARIEDMIRDFGQQIERLNLREAARSWESSIYQPAARLIQSLRLRQFFPGQRTADIFVVLAQIREEESSKAGRELDWQEATALLKARQIPKDQPHAQDG